MNDSKPKGSITMDDMVAALGLKAPTIRRYLWKMDVKPLCYGTLTSLTAHGRRVSLVAYWDSGLIARIKKARKR